MLHRGWFHFPRKGCLCRSGPGGRAVPRPGGRKGVPCPEAAGMGAAAAALLVPIWAVLLAGVTGPTPYRPESGYCRPATEYFARSLGVCCRKCPPGFFAQSLCTRATDTDCVQCAHGEYTEIWNYVRECRVCPNCDPRRNMVVAVNCSVSRRTKCECLSGYYCVGECTDCELHSLCGPGQQVTQPGTSLQDTTCEMCPPGTFKPDSSQQQCRNHTNCREQGLWEITPGTNISDAQCAPAHKGNSIEDIPVAPTKLEKLQADGWDILIPVLTVSVLSVGLFLILLLLGCWWKFRTGRTEKIQSPADGDHTSVESDRPLLGRNEALQEPQQQTIHGPEPVARQRESQQTQQQTGADGGSVGHADWPGASTPPQSHQGQARGLLGLQACHVNTLNSNLTVHGPLYIYNGDPAPAPAPAWPTGPDCTQRWDNGVGTTLGAGVPVSASPEQETGEDPVQGCRAGHLVLGMCEPQQEVGEEQTLRPTAH